MSVPLDAFLGWSGPDQILLARYGATLTTIGFNQYGRQIRALDLRTGTRHTLTGYTGPPVDNFVVAPAPDDDDPAW